MCNRRTVVNFWIQSKSLPQYYYHSQSAYDTIDRKWHDAQINAARDITKVKGDHTGIYDVFTEHAFKPFLSDLYKGEMSSTPKSICSVYYEGDDFNNPQLYIYDIVSNFDEAKTWCLQNFPVEEWAQHEPSPVPAIQWNKPGILKFDEKYGSGLISFLKTVRDLPVNIVNTGVKTISDVIGIAPTIVKYGLISVVIVGGIYIFIKLKR